MVVKDVRHIPSMKRNLISIEQLGDSGYLSTFGETWWNITKGSLIIEKGDRVGMLYLYPHNNDYSISVASTKIGAALWHHRLRHMSEGDAYSSLKEIASRSEAGKFGIM